MKCSFWSRWHHVDILHGQHNVQCTYLPTSYYSLVQTNKICQEKLWSFQQLSKSWQCLSDPCQDFFADLTVFFGANYLGPNLYMCYSNRFLHLWYGHPSFMWSVENFQFFLYTIAEISQNCHNRRWYTFFFTSSGRTFFSTDNPRRTVLSKEYPESINANPHSLT